jgi:hypothetical protein
VCRTQPISEFTAAIESQVYAGEPPCELEFLFDGEALSATRSGLLASVRGISGVGISEGSRFTVRFAGMRQAIEDVRISTATDVALDRVLADGSSNHSENVRKILGMLSRETAAAGSETAGLQRLARRFVQHAAGDPRCGHRLAELATAFARSRPVFELTDDLRLLFRDTVSKAPALTFEFRACLVDAGFWKSDDVADPSLQAADRERSDLSDEALGILLDDPGFAGDDPARLICTSLARGEQTPVVVWALSCGAVGCAVALLGRLPATDVRMFEAAVSGGDVLLVELVGRFLAKGDLQPAFRVGLWTAMNSYNECLFAALLKKAPPEVDLLKMLRRAVDANNAAAAIALLEHGLTFAALRDDRLARVIASDPETPLKEALARHMSVAVPRRKKARAEPGEGAVAGGFGT